MSNQDEKDKERLVVLEGQVIEIMSNLHKIRKLVSELESESDALLRKLLKRNGD